MKFLCRRMQRQKVNGNGIRAAGNPDDEPVLSRYPVCPSVSRRQLERKITERDIVQTDDDDIHAQATKALAALSAASHAVITRDGNKSYDQEEEDEEDDDEIDEDDEPELKQEEGTDSNLKSPSSQPSQAASFPLKLQRILDKLEADGNSDVVSWLSHGRAFQVRDPDRFVDELMPQYFNQTKYSSFQRQLHMYHFERITAGPDKGAYHHPKFLRGHPELSVKMHRTRVNGKGTRRPGNPDTEPNFYAMHPMPPIPRGTVVVIPLDVPVKKGEPASASDGELSDES
jgi:hypothetical protein